MLKQYKNIEDIEFGKSFSTIRFDADDLISYSRDSKYYANDEIVKEDVDRRIELHLYSNDTWISGNHKITSIK